MSAEEEALRLHEKSRGKIAVKSKVKLKNKKDLALAYTPGVAEPCRQISKNKELVYRYTSKGNLVAVVTDGSSVLGLGNIGAEAALPVMEGKCVLFKTFANIDAFPICLATQDTNEIVEAIKGIAPTFGGINLEDISAPRCFEIEERLKALDIPVFHDDQHGTAVVILAGLINALKVTGKEKEKIKTVISGAGAAGIATAKMLLNFGIKNIILLDSAGAIYSGRKENTNPAKEEIARLTNREKLPGKLADIIKGADVFIGVSAPRVLTKEMVKTMNKAVVFAMANPTPEIMPEEAREAGAVIVATGRSDFPNQINNVLCFPGIFRGALDAGAKQINEEMKLAAAHAIADSVEPTPEKIVPDVFDKKLVRRIAAAVKKAAKKSGAAA
jgi:malate dehydrogenase (oxaloacetate-decarboxylating)